MAGEKKIPMRQCIGCREMKPKSELVRVVRTPEGEILLDLSRKANGRGAYFCRNRDCLETAFRKKAVERSLGLSIPDAVKETLLTEMEIVDGR